MELPEDEERLTKGHLDYIEAKTKKLFRQIENCGLNMQIRILEECLAQAREKKKELYQ